MSHLLEEASTRELVTRPGAESIHPGRDGACCSPGSGRHETSAWRGLLTSGLVESSRAGTRYGLALGVLAVAILLRWWLGVACGLTAPFVTLYPAVIAAAAVAGPGPGMLVTLLAAGAAAYWFLPPTGLTIGTLGDVVALALFVGSGLVMSGFAERLRRARRADVEARAVQAANTQLEGRVAERTAEVEAAHRRLAEQSRQFEAFFENAISPLVFLDRDFNFIRVNSAYAAGCQRAISDFPGHNHFELYPHAENQAIFREVVRSKRPYAATAKAFEFPDHPEWGVTYWDWTLVPILDVEGEVDFLVFSLEDVTPRRRAEIELEKYSHDLEELIRRRTDQLEESSARTRRQNTLLEGINRILKEALTSRSDEELGRVCLSVAESVTASKFGFVSEINKAGLLDNVSISDPGWEACRMPNPSGRTPPPTFSVHGIYGRVIQDGKSLIVNEPDSHPDRIGLPPGHPPLTAFLGVPLIRAGRTVGMIGVGNREGAYSEADRDALEGLAPVIVEAIMYRRSEQALRVSEARMSGVVGTAVDGIITIDEDGIIETANAAVERIFGYTREELIGRNVDMLMPGPSTEHKAHIQNYLRTGEGKVIGTGREITGRRKDGSSFPAELAVSEVMLGDRRIFTGMLRDVTERKRTEQNRAMATEVLRLLNRGAGELHTIIGEVLRLVKAYTGLDAVGLRMRKGDDCPYFVQDGFAEEFLREENCLCAKNGDGSILRDESGRPVLECTCGLVLSGRTDPAISCFTPGGSFWTNHSTELLALPREADPRTNPRNRCIHSGYESVALIPVRSGDEIVGLLQLNGRRQDCFTLNTIRFFERLAENIGLGIRRKQTEEDLTAAKITAEQANAAKDHFLAVLSHELRTPLAPVLMMSSALQIDSTVPAWIREEMGMIRRSVDLEVRLIDDLLDINRLSRGKLQLQMEDVDVHAKLSAAVEICRLEAQAKHLVVETDLGAREPRVRGDGARLQQVFWNLLKNAIKFTPEGGHITVRSSSVDGHCRVEIVDTGIGIPPEQIPHLFNAFEQGGEHVTRQFGGLGLGLAITRGLVQMHGGSIAADSAGPGEGARFTVDLPLICAEPQRPPAGAGSKKASRVGLKLLLVEDNEPTAQVLTRLLAKAGHEVVRAASVQEGLSLAESHEIEFVISDLGLPDGSGHDLMEALRATRPGLKGIALSGYGMESDVERSRKAGFCEHLTKPIDFEVLRQAIRRVVGSAT